MRKIINKEGIDTGMIITCYKQGNNWIACFTSNKLDYWVQKQLHYSIQSRKDVEQWAEEFLYDKNNLSGENSRCELIIQN